MKRISFICLLVFIVVQSSSLYCEGKDARATKPNILFIAADDLNCDLHSFGVKQVKTPNLDRLAKLGVRFDRAYCQQPLCGPSRASLMSGLRPNTTGFFSNKDDLRELNPDVVTLGQFFKQKGYYSGRVGKIYHYDNPKDIGTDGHDDPPTWTETFNPAGMDRLQEENITVYPESRKGKGLGVSMAWWDPESRDEQHTDGMVVGKAIEMMEAHRTEPFFIAAGFFNPHCPYVAPKKYFDLYPIEEIDMQDLEEARKDLEDVPPMAVQRDLKNWPYYFPDVTLEEARKCKQAYYACVSFVDAQVGRLLDALETNNLMDKTLIVFWSDHGYFLGEKGLWYKRKAFERSARMPLYIAGPGIRQKGASCVQPVELVDLFPTLVDYAGFKIPEGLDGISLRPLLTDVNAKWDKPAITQIHHSPAAQGYSIRTHDWRYTEWNGGDAGRELYDHRNDPDEKVNLAGNSEYSKMVKSLSEQLQPFRRTYKLIERTKPKSENGKKKKK